MPGHSAAVGPSTAVSGPDRDLTRRFYAAYRDAQRAVLEGYHPARHAVAFGAALELAVTYDRDRLFRLAERLDPESLPPIERVLRVVDRESFARLSRRSLSSPLLSVAPRPRWDLGEVLGRRDRPVVYLERPRHPGNVGAVVRVAAAADVGGVVVSGQVDPWSPVAIRSAAGLQYAVAVGRADLPADSGRPVVAVDVGGEPVGSADLPVDAILAVGGERHGLSPTIRQMAVRSVGVAMRSGVSSLNLATALSAVLFAWKAAARERTGAELW